MRILGTVPTADSVNDSILLGSELFHSQCCVFSTSIAYHPNPNSQDLDATTIQNSYSKNSRNERHGEVELFRLTFYGLNRFNESAKDSFLDHF